MIWKLFAPIVLITSLLTACSGSTSDDSDQTLPTRVVIAEVTLELEATPEPETLLTSEATPEITVEVTAESTVETTAEPFTTELTQEPFPATGEAIPEATAEPLARLALDTSSALSAYDALVEIIDTSLLQWVSVGGNELFGWRFEFATDDQLGGKVYLVQPDGTLLAGEDELTSAPLGILDRAALQVDSSEATQIALNEGFTITDPESMALYLYVDAVGTALWIVNASSQVTMINAITGEVTPNR